jgi:hypothetical protein
LTLEQPLEDALMATPAISDFRKWERRIPQTHTSLFR